ncbi:hypothetical protein ACVWWG_007468 [Bradyrhizobium sp. LB7.2]
MGTITTKRGMAVLYASSVKKGEVEYFLAFEQADNGTISGSGNITIKDHDADGETIMQEAQSSEHPELEIRGKRHPIAFPPGGSNAVRAITVPHPIDRDLLRHGT